MGFGMQIIGFNFHALFFTKYHHSDIIDGAQGFKKFVQGGQQRFNGMALLHGIGIVHHQHNVKRDKFTGLQGFDGLDLSFSFSAFDHKIFGFQSFNGIILRIFNRYQQAGFIDDLMRQFGFVARCDDLDGFCGQAADPVQKHHAGKQ